MAVNRNFSDDLEPLGLERRWVSPQPVPTSRIQVDRFQTDAGAFDMNVNGSVTPVVFKAPIPPSFNALVLNINFFIRDTGIRPSRFGGLAALTNGCTIGFKDVDDEVIALAGVNPLLNNGGVVYKTNADWAQTAGTNIHFWFGNGTDDMFSWGYNFADLGISIQLKENEYVELVVNDDLTSLDSFMGSLTCRLIGP